MNITLADWLKQHGWERLDGGMFYSREGSELVDAPTAWSPSNCCHESAIWVNRRFTPAPEGWSGGYIDPLSRVAGYFTDEDVHLFEYTFGPAAKELAKAITQYRAGKD
jgi:hypothetical protein